jgi:hypothetical protein
MQRTALRAAADAERSALIEIGKWLKIEFGGL